MPGFTDYAANIWLTWVTGRGQPPALFQVYCGLFTTAPTNDAGTGGVEVSGNAYARQSVPFGAPNASSGGEPTTVPAFSTNSDFVLFPAASAAWGTIQAFGLFDSVSGGNMLAWDWYGSGPWQPATVALGSPAVFTSPNHGFVSGSFVTVSTKVSGNIPELAPGGTLTGLLQVSQVTSSTFAVAGVTVSTVGDLLVRSVSLAVVNAGGQVKFNPGQITLRAA